MLLSAFGGSFPKVMRTKQPEISMETKVKPAPESESSASRNMALSKPVPRVAPKVQKSAAPASKPSKPIETRKAKWDPSALYF